LIYNRGAWLTSSIERKRLRSIAFIFISKNFSLIILFRIINKGVITMVGIIKRFEVISKGVLELVV
jgi:hypothetical protein